MSGTLIVQNLQGPASGANANKIIVPAGQVLDASAGTFTPSAGQVLQYKYGTTQSYTGSASSSYIATNLKVDIAPKSSTSLLVFYLATSYFWNADITTPANNYLVFTLYKDNTANIFSGLAYASMAFQGNVPSSNNYDRLVSPSGNYAHGGTAGVSQEYRLYCRCYTTSTSEWRVCSATSPNILHCWEIAQ